jgi:UDP-N-acetylmuramyl pentapeptide phosphotransferase/UDP-N-acetylglucosamine-1-phosphate transferase
MNAVALLAALAPAIVAAGVIAALRRSRIAALLVDRPNERSLHETPTPRLGGIGVAAGIASVAALFWTWPLSIVFGVAGLLFAISLADDARSLSMQARLAAHFAAAGVVAALYVSNASDEPVLRAVVFGVAVLAVAWMTNLFNFMDGTDGLAGGMAAIGFGALAAAAWAAGATALALAALATASASAGFLAHNLPPARVFLGDAGSIPLGFLAAALGLHGAAAGFWPAWFPALVFSPFIVDATATLVARVLGRKRFWRAHREHYYQRLVLAGWPRRRLVVAAYALMTAAAASALLGLAAGEEVQLGILLGWAAAYPPLLLAIDRHARRAGESDSSRRSVG